MATTADKDNIVKWSDVSRRLTILEMDNNFEEVKKSISDIEQLDARHTIADQTKLANIEAGAEVNTVKTVNTKTGNVVLDKTDIGLSNVRNVESYSKTETDSLLGETFTTVEKTKLNSIEDGAEVNDVTSVNGRQGDVNVTKADVDLTYVRNVASYSQDESDSRYVSKIKESILNKSILVSDFTNNDYQLYSGPSVGIESKTFSEMWNFGRSSPATVEDAFNNTTEVLSNLPRFYGVNDGLIIEDQKVRLNTISLAPTDPENITVTAVSHTISFYGSGSISISGAATGVINGVSDDVRTDYSFNPSAGTLTLTPTGTVSNLQLEVGSMSSVIFGEGSTQTRSSDSCYKSLVGILPNKFTIYTEATITSTENENYNSLVSIGSSLTNAVAALFKNNQLEWRFYNDGLTLKFPSVTNTKSNVKVALSYDNGNIIASANGFSKTGNLTTSLDLSAMSLVLSNIGDISETYNVKNKIQKSVYLLPVSLSEPELQVLTA